MRRGVCTNIGDNGDNGDVKPILSETLPDMISVKELVSWIGLEFPSYFPLKIFKGTIKFLSIFLIDVQFPFFGSPGLNRVCSSPVYIDLIATASTLSTQWRPIFNTAEFKKRFDCIYRNLSKIANAKTTL